MFDVCTAFISASAASRLRRSLILLVQSCQCRGGSADHTFWFGPSFKLFFFCPFHSHLTGLKHSAVSAEVRRDVLTGSSLKNHPSALLEEFSPDICPKMSANMMGEIAHSSSCDDRALKLPPLCISIVLKLT